MFAQLIGMKQNHAELWLGLGACLLGWRQWSTRRKSLERCQAPLGHGGEFASTTPELVPSGSTCNYQIYKEEIVGRAVKLWAGEGIWPAKRFVAWWGNRFICLPLNGILESIHKVLAVVRMLVQQLKIIACRSNLSVQGDSVWEKKLRRTKKRQKASLLFSEKLRLLQRESFVVCSSSSRPAHRQKKG